MARLLGPDFLALQVRDLDAARGFYTEMLGLVPTHHSNADAVVFDTAPMLFAIRKPLVDLDASMHLGWGVSLWIACDDANALHDKLHVAGVAILRPPFDSPFGRAFVFRDPDGYMITVHQQ